MTKLAIIDKNTSKRDKLITSYYPEDYRYVNNFWTRVSVLCVVGGIIILDFMLKIEKGINIPDNPIQIIGQYIIPYGTFLGITLIVYSILSTVVYNKKYVSAHKRSKEYDNLLRELEDYEKELTSDGGDKYDT